MTTPLLSIIADLKPANAQDIVHKHEAYQTGTSRLQNLGPTQRHIISEEHVNIISIPKCGYKYVHLFFYVQFLFCLIAGRRWICAIWWWVWQEPAIRNHTNECCLCVAWVYVSNNVTYVMMIHLLCYQWLIEDCSNQTWHYDTYQSCLCPIPMWM